MPDWQWGRPCPDTKADRKRLAKKHASFEADLAAAQEEIRVAPLVRGSGQLPIPGYRGLVWKKRFANSAARRGRSGGFRLWYYLCEARATPHLVRVESKTVREDISRRELKDSILAAMQAANAADE